MGRGGLINGNNASPPKFSAKSPKKKVKKKAMTKTRNCGLKTKFLKIYTQNTKFLKNRRIQNLSVIRPFKLRFLRTILVINAEKYLIEILNIKK